MIPMTSPTYRVVAMKNSTQKTVERIEEGSLVRLVIDLGPTTRGFGHSGPYATECYLVKLDQGEWKRCSDYLSTNNMIKKLCIVPKGIDPTPYAKAKSGPLLVLVEE